MKGFTALDYGLVVLYLVGIAAIGSSFYRRKSTAKDYFLGGRALSWIPVGISLVAADLSAITIMGVPAWSYKHNIELLVLAFGYPLMVPVVIKVFVPFYSRLNLYTAYEYLERRFSLAVRVVTSALFQILRGMHVAIVIYAPSLVISIVTGLPVWQCILFMGGFTTFYTTLGGMKAVIWTDVIQFVVVSAGVFLIFYNTLGRIQGGIPHAYQAAVAAGKLRLLNFSSDPSQLTSVWALLVGGFVLSMAPVTTDQAIIQRLFTTKSTKDCRQSIILQSLIIIPITTTLYLAGVALFVFYQSHPERVGGLANADAVMPFFAVHELPAGVSGLVIAAIFGASMAVMSAGINSLTTATSVDFYQRLCNPLASPHQVARIGRIGTAAWGLAMTGMALLAGRLGELAIAYNLVSSHLSGPLLGIFLLAVLTSRTTAMGALAGSAAGVVVVALASALTQWSFFYFAPIGVAVTVCGGYLASLFMSPPPPEKIHGLVLGQGQIEALSRD
ncbi:MAG: sodium/solute symporter [Acidobacteria bacterium]|nr:sodium/solute symporter [Acidobacteriota bacterium]